MVAFFKNICCIIMECLTCDLENVNSHVNIATAFKIIKFSNGVKESLIKF